jgi:hypothetical protein
MALFTKEQRKDILWDVLIIAIFLFVWEKIVPSSIRNILTNA